jgi:hypothetical protein
MSFYFVHFDEDETLPVARRAESIDADSVEAQIAQAGEVREWTPLRWLVDGTPTDYLANDLALRLCSPRLRAVIESALSPDDEVQWLDAPVRDQAGNEALYHVLHVVSRPDVWDDARTIRVGGSKIVKPVVDVGLVGSRQVIAMPGEVTRLIIAGALREAIEGAKCTGLDYTKVAASEGSRA